MSFAHDSKSNDTNDNDDAVLTKRLPIFISPNQH